MPTAPRRASSAHDLEERLGGTPTAAASRPSGKQPAEGSVAHSAPILASTQTSKTQEGDHNSSSSPSAEEIHFLADELTEEVNTALASVLYQLKNPYAAQRAEVLRRFVFEAVRAFARRRRERSYSPLWPVTPAQRSRHFVRTQHVAVQQPVQQAKQAPATPKLRTPPPAVPAYQRSVLEPPKPSPKTPVVHVPLIFDERKQALVGADISGSNYKVVEPPLLPSLGSLLALARKEIDPDVVRSDRGLYRALFDLAKKQKIRLDDQSYAVLHYYLDRDLVRLGKITPLFSDPKISQIICEEPTEPVVVIRDSDRLATNIRFSGTGELNALLKYIAKKTFQALDLDNPALDVTYGEFRIQATLGTDMVPARFIATRLLQ